MHRMLGLLTQQPHAGAERCRRARLFDEQILPAITPLMLWTSADAANVMFDGSEPTRHDTALVETRRNKDRDFMVFESFRDPDGKRSPTDRSAGLELTEQA